MWILFEGTWALPLSRSGLFFLAGAKDVKSNRLMTAGAGPARPLPPAAPADPVSFNLLTAAEPADRARR